MPSAFLFPGAATTLFDTPTIVGTTPWDDELDDSTYVTCTQNSKAPFDFSYTYRADTAQATLPALDASITPTAILLHVRFSGTSNHHAAGLAHAFPRLINGSTGAQVIAFEDQRSDTWDPPASPSTVWFDLASITPGGSDDHYTRFGTSLAAVTTLLKSGNAIMRLGMPNFTSSVPAGIYTDTITFYAYYLEVQYENRRKPHQRIHPRADGYGASTAPRVYPPSRSRQATNRRAGGAFF